MGHQKSDEPILLEEQNFTPPSRTPWGGERIRALKGMPPGQVVGESWEVSVEPSFPSVGLDGRTLAERLDAAALGEEAARGGTALLVKLLDTADALSVQIHPRDDAPGLAPDESGKPESWYVVAREPGAGLYLGLAEGADEARVRAALDGGADLSSLLGFVPVEPGDFFVIEAGTPHCIGRGVLLVEPQRVAPGRRGVTYRYWDWNRRYDEGGRRDPGGEPRALHREEALAVTRWDLPRGEALLERVRVRAGAPCTEARVEALCGPSDAPLRSEALAVARLSGTGEVTMPDWNLLTGLTVLDGVVTLGDLRVPRGRSAALPASWRPRIAQLEGAHAIIAATPYRA